MRNFIRLLHKGIRSPRRALGHVVDKCRFAVDRRERVPFLVVITGQKCTLRCKDCANFSPYLPQEYYSIETVCDDFQKLARIACVSNLQIQGGEALISPGLVKLLKCVQPASRAISIATNGTRLLSQKQIEVIKSVRASVRISDYNINQQRSVDLMAQCKDNGIPSHLYQFALGSGNWIEMGDRCMERKGDVETHDVFKSCPFKVCLTLEDGIIARCSRATVAHHIQDFSPNEADFVHVRMLDSKQLRYSLVEYMRDPSPMEACRYCRGGMGQKIRPAIQINRTTPN